MHQVHPIEGKKETTLVLVWIARGTNLQAEGSMARTRARRRECFSRPPSRSTQPRVGNPRGLRGNTRATPAASAGSHSIFPKKDSSFFGLPRTQELRLLFSTDLEEGVLILVMRSAEHLCRTNALRQLRCLSGWKEYSHTHTG